MMRWRRSLPVAVVVIAGGLLLLRQAAPRAPVDALPGAPPPVAAEAHPLARPGRTTAEAASHQAHATMPDLPETGLAALRERLAHSSLRGATPDGELTLDASGRVLPDRGLRRLFDHFLSLSGEFSLSEIRALVADRVRGTLGDAQVADVLRWFDRYCDLRIAEGAASAGDPQAHAVHLKTLRRRHLGNAVAQAWFGAEEAELDLALARLAVRDAPGVEPEERQQWLDELDQARADEVQEVLRGSLDASLAQAQAARFEAENADAATRHDERAALWGEDAALRLAQLDAQNADWAVRLRHYRTARAAMAAEPAAFDAWLQANFSAPERRRIIALEAIGDGDP